MYWFALKHVNAHLHSLYTQLIRGLFHGGKHGPSHDCVSRVIKADNRYLLRHRNLLLIESQENASCYLVFATDDGIKIPQ